LFAPDDFELGYLNTKTLVCPVERLQIGGQTCETNKRRRAEPGDLNGSTQLQTAIIDRLTGPSKGFLIETTVCSTAVKWSVVYHGKQQ
jgi:hypothetical protein